MRIELGAFGLRAFDGRVSFTIVDSETGCSIASVLCRSFQECYDLAKHMKLKNLENVNTEKFGIKTE